MSQHDMSIANQGFPAFRADLNDALSALATTSAGTAEPSTTFANQLWYDSTNDLLKMRNSDNDAWITLAYFDQTADEWQLRSAVIQAVDAAGVQIKTDEGTTRIDIQDDGDVSIDSGTLFVDAGVSKVGIGTTSPDATLTVSADPDETAFKSLSSVGGNLSVFTIEHDSDLVSLTAFNSGDALAFGSAGTEAMRIDSLGNFIIGKTGTSATTDGVVVYGQSTAKGATIITRNDERPLLINRRTSDGVLIELRKDNAAVGEIGADAGDLYIGTNAHGIRFADGSADIRPFNTTTGADTNGSTDLGGSGVRFREIFATNGTINTSDKNEKQDIEELSEAEQRVAVAAKGLLRKFRWKDMVAEKGDDARIHFGIMAQDLQAAFEAEGLDAGRYSMFVKETYYELLTDVPAVEAQDAVLDDEGNIVTEAVEAKEAYTKRTVYKAHEEIPEDAQAVTTYGVRYSELLAFIIAAI